MQPTHKGVSKNNSGRCVECLDSRQATQIDLAQAIAPAPMQPPFAFNPLRALSKLREQIEIWVNEGGAGGEANA